LPACSKIVRRMKVAAGSKQNRRAKAELVGFRGWK
jgi:hypothetical protein